ncbi:MAG: ComEC/Rec2 family competence protein, partial [Bacteroidales bacterium]|nr:ComEC/Rec2 family competence protein [Bacteroidales bacterium]
MNSFIFQQAPFLRIVIPLISGMILAPFEFLPGLLFSLILLMPAVFLRLFVPKAGLAWRLRKLPGFLFFMCWFSLGSALFQGRQQQRACPQLESYYLRAEFEILSTPQIKPNSLQCQVRVIFTEPVCWKNKRCVLYLAKDSQALALRAGNRIRVQTTMSPYSRRSRPMEFSYERYLLNKGFCAGAFVPARAWQLQSRQLSLRAKVDALRDCLVGRFRQAGLDEGPLALVSALVLGSKDQMEAEQRQAFSSAGVAHILAVSGMHVSILFLLLGKLLFFIKPSRAGLFFKQSLLVALLWVYAFVTGMSASVLRAVLMCSVSALGLCLGRRSNSWNLLAFAAFVLLIVNPGYLMDVSFQLSFVAVASIMLLLPEAGFYLGVITERPAPAAGKGIKDKIVRIYRDTLLLSLVAQLGTAPLSIYYFNQFPQYFLLGNLLLVPLATFLFYLCFGFILLSPVPWLSEVLVWPVNALAGFFCSSSAFIEKLPGSLATELWPSKPDVLICYLLLALLFYLFKNKRYIYALNKLIS